MVIGIESFRNWFKGFEDQYVIIGGTACDILMAEEGLDFRATKDIDLVLIVEAINADFGRSFWEYVKAAGYQHCIPLPEDAVLTPLPMEDDISSLSAILLDDAYYTFLKAGKTNTAGVTVLDAAYLIPFKAKAWLDLSERKSVGEQVDSKNIRKHKNDVFRLTELIDASTPILAPASVREDIHIFVSRMVDEDVDLKQLGIVGRSKEQILQELEELYRE